MQNEGGYTLYKMSCQMCDIDIRRQDINVYKSVEIKGMSREVVLLGHNSSTSQILVVCRSKLMIQ